MWQNFRDWAGAGMAETGAMALLALGRQEEEPPWEGHLSVAAEVPESEEVRGGVGEHSLTLGLDYLLCKMGLLKSLPCDIVMDRLLGYWIPPSACSEVMVARTSCCLHCRPLLSCHSFAFPQGGMVLGEVKRLLYLSEHMFVLRPGSWGSPPPPVILGTLCCRFREGLEGGLCGMEGGWQVPC